MTIAMLMKMVRNTYSPAQPVLKTTIENLEEDIAQTHLNLVYFYNGSNLNKSVDQNFGKAMNRLHLLKYQGYQVDVAKADKKFIRKWDLEEIPTILLVNNTLANHTFKHLYYYGDYSESSIVELYASKLDNVLTKINSEKELEDSFKKFRTVALFIVNKAGRDKNNEHRDALEDFTFITKRLLFVSKVDTVFWTDAPAIIKKHNVTTLYDLVLFYDIDNNGSIDESHVKSFKFSIISDEFEWSEEALLLKCKSLSQKTKFKRITQQEHQDNVDYSFPSLFYVYNSSNLNAESHENVLKAIERVSNDVETNRQIDMFYYHVDVRKKSFKEFFTKFGLLQREDTEEEADPLPSLLIFVGKNKDFKSKFKFDISSYNLTESGLKDILKGIRKKKFTQFYFSEKPQPYNIKGVTKVVGKTFEDFVRIKGRDTIIFNVKKTDYYYKRVKRVIDRLADIVSANNRTILIGEYDTSLNEYEDSIEFESHPGMVFFANRVGDKLENLAFYHGKITTRKIIEFINDIAAVSSKMRNLTRTSLDEKLDEEEEREGIFTLTDDDRNFDLHSSDSKEDMDKEMENEQHLRDIKDFNIDETRKMNQNEDNSLDNEIKIFEMMQKEANQIKDDNKESKGKEKPNGNSDEFNIEEELKKIKEKGSKGNNRANDEQVVNPDKLKELDDFLESEGIKVDF